MTFHRLIARWRTMEAALDALARVAPNVAPPPIAAIEREFEALEARAWIWPHRASQAICRCWRN